MVIDKYNGITYCFYPDPSEEADKMARSKIANELQKQFKDEFRWIYFSTCSHHRLKQRANHIRYHQNMYPMFYKTFKEELE